MVAPAIQHRSSCTAMALRARKQPMPASLGCLCLEMSGGLADACFALGRRVQRCFGRITRRNSGVTHRAGIFQIADASTRRAWRFWSRGEPSGRRRVPKQTRVGAPATTFCWDSEGHYSTRSSQNTYAAAPKFLQRVNDLQRSPVCKNSEPDAHIWRARAASPNAPPAAFSGQRGAAQLGKPAEWGTPASPRWLARATPPAPSKKWPDAAAPPVTFLCKSSPTHREPPAAELTAPTHSDPSPSQSQTQQP